MVKRSPESIEVANKGEELSLAMVKEMRKRLHILPRKEQIGAVKELCCGCCEEFEKGDCC